MWFNSTQREEPYLDLTSFDHPGNRVYPTCRNRVTGAAWLSSARVVRCWVKSRNERNPVFSCQYLVRHSKDTASVNGEEGGDDVKSSWPLYPGLHTCYNGLYKGLLFREKTLIPKSSPQFGLESATRLHEVGIASNRGSACHGEYVPGSCTHRPSHHESWLYQKLLG